MKIIELSIIFTSKLGKTLPYSYKPTLLIFGGSTFSHRSFILETSKFTEELKEKAKILCERLLDDVIAKYNVVSKME